MTSITHVVGIDPGLVHTGVVSMEFSPGSRLINIRSEVFDGPDAEAVAQWVEARRVIVHKKPIVFIEKYVPRQRFGTDENMVKAEAAFTAALPKAKLIRNTGVTKIVTPRVLAMLDVWQFNTTTHHQDLRAAAKILLYGMLKEPALNQLLADVVRDNLDGTPWETGRR